MNLPKLSDLDVSGKKVLLRADLDIDVGENYRLEAFLPTLEYLSSKSAKIILLGHRGRPGGVYDDSLSLRPVENELRKIAAGINFEVLENLRFDPGEEKNDPEFAKRLASLGDIFVNEAFGNSHRVHASIVGLPKLLPRAAGLRFVKEVENLSKVLNNPKRPVVYIIGGVKKDKLDYLPLLEKIADKILVGGRLPAYAEISNKFLVANLQPDKEDITLNSIERFEEEIAKAGTIVLAGPMGRYEDKEHRQGTERIFKAVASSKAFRVAGGGDTEKAVEVLSLSKKFDWVSLGGGAMLEFLVNKTLPGIEAMC